jgi:hypothetical protein
MDLPRLLSSNVALQMFTIVSRVPAELNVASNVDPALTRDLITLIAIANRWGIKEM